MDPSLTLPPSLVGIITPSTAHALSFLFTSSYVGSLYISQKFLSTSTPTPKSSRPITPKEDGNSPAIPPISSTDVDDVEIRYENGPKPGSRDHPETIKKRMIAVTISTVLSLSGVHLTINHLSHPSNRIGTELRQSLTLLGLRLPTLKSSAISNVLPWTLAPILMTGPLVSMYLDGDLPIVGGRHYNESIVQRLKRGWREFGLIEFRNYGVGPITEELVFRSTILAVSILGGLTFRSLVFGTPLWFGIAHAHHALETYRKNGSTRDAAIHAILGCLFQLGYTTLFGWFASYLFLTTGSVIPPLSSHVFCNIMGIYLPSTAIARHPKKKILIWTSYLAGIAGFVWGVRRL
ncbi:hypothetical protein I302_103599 [Kwoniella bestiolae CBS 10118]|uniref:intramembrane prenyl-peptidase Rce1 n=1 Tax=Kwoniella bestiolae CBS 10118 TaxID=1296100 RepID=A0A1B9G8X2_9TREE|nr:hypothetical protein I302_02301 [Kwoniella bestiolae CBS 10118]OCF27459.1 hypothetical protein I302_02301 [Kwoniella bestiolae CBS 10118]